MNKIICFLSTLLRRLSLPAGLLLSCLCYFHQSHATHVMGSDMHYECLGNGKYKLVFTIYRDCSGIDLSSPLTYDINCGNTVSTSRSVSRFSRRDITGIQQNCNTQSKCASTTTTFPYGYEEHVYIDTIDLSSYNCCEFVISFSNCCRNSSISTGSADENFYSEITLNKCLVPCNSSPRFTNPPVALFCDDQDASFNNGALDTLDIGDSLSYELTTSLEDAGVSVSYTGSFSYKRPLTFLGFPNENSSYPNGFHLDPQTGDLSFRPTKLNEISVLAIRVKEWRKDSTGKWVNIGSSRRDMQVIIYNCNTNKNPISTGNELTKICAGDSACIKIVAIDSNANDTARLSWNRGIPGASFIKANNKAKRDTAYICWKTTDSDVSPIPYSFTITAQDNNCPLAGRSIKSYQVMVGKVPKATLKVSVDSCKKAKLIAIPQENYGAVTHTWAILNRQKDTVYKTTRDTAYAYVSDTGKYYVAHTIATGFSCATSSMDSFTIGSTPKISTSLLSDSSVCIHSPINIQSTVNGGSAPLHYLWSTAASDTGNQLSFIASRDSQVVVRVWDMYRCYHYDTMRVKVVPYPVGKLRDTLLCPYDAITLDAGNAEDAQSYTWSTGQTSRTIQVKDVGTYWVKVTDTLGCATTDTMKLQKNTIMPFAGIDRENCHHDTAQLTGSGGDSYRWHREPDTATLSYSNVFNAASNDTGTHLYIVWVTKTENNLTCTVRDTMQVLTHPLPVISFPNYPAICKNESAITLNVSGNTLTGGTWKCDTDPTLLSGNIFITPWAVAGDYKITYTVTNGNQCSNNASFVQTIKPLPVIDFAVNNDSQCVRGNSFQFSNNTTISGGSSLSYTWFFGDGNSSSSEEPSYSYGAYGRYRITLAVSAGNNCRDTLYDTVTVHAQPKAAFAVDDSTQCLRDHLFSITNQSTIAQGSMQYTWKFGDGNTSAATSPSHSYTTHGKYTVKLVTISDQLCGDSITHNTEVFPQPDAGIQVDDTAKCFRGHQFSLIDNSSIAYGKWHSYWETGDAHQDTNMQFNYSYAAYGNYQVKLKVVSYEGCDDSAMLNLTVHPQPKAAFMVNSDAQCLRNHLFSTTNQSTLAQGTSQYTWYFGDGNSSNATSPSHTYATHGTYPIKLVVVSDKQCKDSTISNVEVFPQPSAKITLPDPAQCFRGNRFSFTDSSTLAYGQKKKLWSMGDGNSDTSAQFTHSYAVFGKYDVWLKITTDKQCTDSTLLQVTVHPQPQAVFSIDDSLQCMRNHAFNTNNQSTLAQGSLQYAWIFGDGNNSTAVSPSHSYATYGNYIIKLIATSDKNCKDSLQRPVEVFPQPQAKWTVPDTAQCFRGNSFSLTDNSTIASGQVQRLWSLGDGNSDTASHFTYSYAAFGKYKVWLKVISGKECDDSVQFRLTVHPQMQPAFSTNDSAQCLNSHSFNFDANASSIPAGSIASYNWQLGDGTKASGKLIQQKKYTLDDTLRVELLTISDQSCRDSVSHQVILFPKAVPVIGTSSPDMCFSGNLFQLNGSLSHTPYGTLDSFYWNFGNGATASGITPPGVSYNRHDTFEVRLITQTGFGCYDTAYRPLVVHPQPLTTIFIPDKDMCLSGNRFQFNGNSSSIPYGAISQYEWSFSDGNTATGVSHTRSFAVSDTFQVKLKTISNMLCADSATTQVIVHPQPVSIITASDSALCLRGNRFVFDGKKSGVSSGTLASYDWDFGDGKTGSGMTPSALVYSLHGKFQVRLKVTTDKGCEDSSKKQVIIHPQANPLINVMDSVLCISNNKFTFSAAASQIPTGFIQTYQWKFSDGEGFSGTTVSSKKFKHYDTFNLKLKTITDKGCTDSISRKIIVYPQPRAVFTINDSQQCFSGHNFTFNAGLSSIAWGSIDRYDWKISDGIDAQGVKLENKTFATEKTYHVRLMVTSDQGCKDSTSRHVSFHPAPVPKFTINQDRQCFKNHRFILSARNSGISSGFISSFRWDFSDGNVSSIMEPAAKYYAAPDTFTIKLLTVSNRGCKDSVSGQVIVMATPQPDFTVNDVCMNDPSIFVDQSTIGYGYTISSWDWHMGLNHTYSDQNPVHLFEDTGYHDVYLKVISNTGCVNDTLVKRAAFVKPVPVANFTYKKIASDFVTATYTFKDASKDAVSWNWDLGNGNTAIADEVTETYNDAGTFPVSLEITNKYACTARITRSVFIAPDYDFLIPNAFTPTMDDLNDRFGGVAMKYVLEYNMKIYNRWGELLFESNALDQQWDGSFKGQPCPDGVYVYLVRVRDIYRQLHNYHGNVTLLR